MFPSFDQSHSCFNVATQPFPEVHFYQYRTLKYLALEGPSVKASDFTVNWAFLTSLTLNGYFCRLGRNLSAREITKNPEANQAPNILRDICRI